MVFLTFISFGFVFCDLSLGFECFGAKSLKNTMDKYKQLTGTDANIRHMEVPSPALTALRRQLEEIQHRRRLRIAATNIFEFAATGVFNCHPDCFIVHAGPTDSAVAADRRADQSPRRHRRRLRRHR